ncbi:hypothetical protein GQ53DRAFT_694802 [Thozetella sp. PMI_491]|nr:hypothetical protein GQ53DRAFT_694802 [Thozetella sp. PMI_491]
MPTPRRASQACGACRRLKRRCTKELPACSLCTRLGKACQYTLSPAQSDPDELDREALIAMIRQLKERIPESQRGTSVDTPTVPAVIPPASVSRFPSAFFIDPEFLIPISQAPPLSLQPPFEVTSLIGEDYLPICHEYFATIHRWFSFISPKRTHQRLEGTRDIGLAILVLCMKLVCEATDLDNPADSPTYCLAKQLLAKLEDDATMALTVLQCTILMALYEIGQGLLSAAYLSVGRAARLGIMMGLHCRDPQRTTQMYKSANSWTVFEEGRRVWWAVIVLDRYVSIGPKGLPLSTPEPSRQDLLPLDDTRWNEGEIGPNEPVYTSQFSTVARIGPFARACQSAHMLGHVIKHRDEAHRNRCAQLEEAIQLHTTLLTLDTRLLQDTGIADAAAQDTGDFIDLALCCLARLSLYNMYACNETVSEERVPQESEMQAFSLAGIKSIGAERVPVIARKVLQEGEYGLSTTSPLILQCLYHAATECQWFVREEAGNDMSEALQLILDSLMLLTKRWKVASTYLELLDSE